MEPLARPDRPSAVHLDNTVAALASASGVAESPRTVSAPLLRALHDAGTSHLYADTASVDELKDLVRGGTKEVIAEIDGNTANQPLVEKVLDDYTTGGSVAGWVRVLRDRRPAIPGELLLPILYAVICGRIGNEIVRRFAGHRAWEVSLQLHMGLVADPGAAVEIGRHLQRMVPSALVKVPFAPHAPAMLLVARELERRGIPVNLTSTFSARQAVAAALLCDATRTNIFMGRLNQGLHAELLGEHVDLCAQRHLRRLREEEGLETMLIVASIHEWRTFTRTAGCDVYTAPCSVVEDLLRQREVDPAGIKSKLETSYEDHLGIPPYVEERIGRQRIERLWRVEPEFVEFLSTYRASKEYDALEPERGGERLARRFEEAGFGDFFLSPDAAGWRKIREGKLPDLDAPITKQVALDTLYSLMADADFSKHQEAMDEALERSIRDAI